MEPDPEHEGKKKKKKRRGEKRRPSLHIFDVSLISWSLLLAVGEDCEEGQGASDWRPGNSYLPGRGDTMIRKVVHPGRGSAIALRLC